MMLFVPFNLRREIQHAIIALLMATLLISICACNSISTNSSGKNELTWQEQYDLGIRYLSEGNYEEAIIAFTVAIEIDSKRAPAYVGRGDAYVLSGETDENMVAAQADYEKAIELDETNVDAYLGLADVYVWQGDYDGALDILRNGQNKTGDNPDILSKILEIENNTNNFNLLGKGITDDMIRFEEVNFLGHSIENLDIWTMKDLMQQDGARIDERGEDDYWWIGSHFFDIGYGAEVSALQYKSEDYVSLWGYDHYTSSKQYLPLPIGVRDIYTCDTLEKVMTQLGFSNGLEISEYIQKIATTSYNSMEEIRQLLNELEYTNWEPESEMTTRFMFTGNGSCTILDDGTYMPAWIEFEVSFFDSNKKSYSLTFRFGDTSWYQFSDCLYSYDVNIW